MLAQVFNPTEIKKNGPATRPAIAPARRTASPFRAALAVLPATSQSYGDARVIVNGDHHRWWLCVPREFTATLHRVAVQVWQQFLDALTLAKPSEGAPRAGLASNPVFEPTQIDDEWATASKAETGDQFRVPAAALRGVALIGSTECADLEPWRFRAAHRLRDRQTSQVRNSTPRYFRGFLCSLLSISSAVRPGVAGCLGNGSMLAQGGSFMERLWIREVRRAARRASAPFARQIALGCGAAAVGTMVASLLPLQLDGAVAQAAWAAVWAVAGYVAIWTGLLIYHVWRYRSSGFRDHDWLARHDDSDPDGALFLELGPRSSGSPNPGVDLELCVKSHGKWEVVDDEEVVLMPDKVIRCRFDLNHEVFAGGFYDVRWFRADDRGKLVEITRERFQLRDRSVGRRTGSASRINRRLAPKALPTGTDEIKPRRAVEAR
jgi:hypothetical protein